MYAVQEVANYFLELAERDGVQVNHLKLQKLVYISHGCSLGIKEQALVEEHPHAWRFGPVFPELFSEFEAWGDRPITSFAKNDDGVPFSLGDGEEADSTRQCLDKMWMTFKDMSSAELSSLVNGPGSPWDQIRRLPMFRRLRPGGGWRIPAKLLGPYFRVFAEQYGINNCFSQ